MSESALSTTPQPGGAAPPAPAPGDKTTSLSLAYDADVPDKYRVNGADGSLDAQQTLAKVSKGYKELMAIRPPELPTDESGYEVKDLPNALSFEELKKDPELAGWLKGAHAKGMSNAQVQHVFEGLANYIGAEQIATKAECDAALAQVWEAPDAVKGAKQAAVRALQAFAGEANLDMQEIDARYGNDPMFIRLLAAVGAKIAEDVPPPPGDVVTGDLDTQLADIDAQLMALDVNDPKRGVLLAAKLKLYERRSPAKRAPLVTSP